MANVTLQLEEQLSDLRSNEIAYRFIAENRESLGTTSDKLASVSTAMTQSLDDIKQALHILPTVAANAANLTLDQHRNFDLLLDNGTVVRLRDPRRAGSTRGSVCTIAPSYRWP